MKQGSNVSMEHILTPLLAKRMLIGAVIGLGVILFFVLGVDQARPEWGNYWMVRPLIVEPLAGAAGAAFFHVMDVISKGEGWKRAAAMAAGFLVFIIGIWMGIVVGLHGTMWN